MFRDGHFKPKQDIQILFNEGGLGDHIARMSAVSYLKKNFKFININLFVPDYFDELARNLVPNITVWSFSKGKDSWRTDLPLRQTLNAHTQMKSHITDHAFHVLCDKQPEIEDRNYCKLNTSGVHLDKFNLPGDYVVITTGFTAEVREMTPQVINTIISYLLFKKIKPVFLGSRQTYAGDDVEKIVGNFNQEINYSSGIDLIDKTSLIEAGAILASAKAVVGLDNGLLHLAGTTDVPIVAGYTTVDPKYRLPYRNNELGWNCWTVQPEEDLKCKFCQSNWDFIYKHDFRKCYYKENKLDKEIKCVSQLKAEKYIQHLEKII